jgi:TRAP-type C4-dicarboxylate transport system substrate-binding protein
MVIARPGVVVSAFVLAGVCMVQAASLRAQEPTKSREWKLSVAVGPAFALGQAADAWAKRIAERSGGTIVIALHPGASLAKRDPEREFVALRDGAADLAVGSTLHWSAQVEALAVAGLPWLAPETRQLALLATGEVKDRLFAAVEAAGAVPLALAPLGHRAIAARAKAVRSPDDLRGLRMRIAGTRYLVDFYAALGAQPHAMSLADAAAAFRAGTLDAQEGPVAAMVAARVDALGLRHVTLWGAVAELAVFAVNRAVWEAWTAEVREQVGNAARDAAGELAQLALNEEQTALATLKGRDADLLRLTASGSAAFAAAARPTYDKWAAVAGAELVRAAERAVAAATPP